MNRFAYIFFWASAALGCCIPCNGQVQNVALGKSYICSPEPNYRHSNAHQSKNNLTDGIKDDKSDQLFWLRSSTTGWNYVNNVQIDVDLKDRYYIEGIRLNSVQDEKRQIFFPEHAFVFISNDSVQFQYVGDLIGKSSTNPHRATSLVKEFVLGDIKYEGRYVRISIIPRGKFIFTNEIEVLASSGGLKRLALKTANLLAEENIKEKVTAALIDQKNKQFLQIAIDSLKSNTGREINGNIRSFTELQLLFSHYLSENFSDPLIIHQVNPWGTYNKWQLPKNFFDRKGYKIYNLLNSSVYGAVSLTNTTQNNAIANVRTLGKTKVLTSLYICEFVFGSNKEMMDALLEYNEGTPINIEPGQTKMILFRVSAIDTGINKVTLAIKGMGQETNIPIQLTTLKPEGFNSSLNAVNWAYFNTPILASRKIAALKDLNQHGINTFVCPTNVLGYLDSREVENMVDYLEGVESDRKILLFYNLKNSNIKTIRGTTKFMSDEWKILFKEWYNTRFKTLVSLGYKPENIYFYPYDEPKGREIDEFVAFARWAKSEMPFLRLFLTALREETLKASEYADIVTVSDRLLENRNSIRGKEIWIYSILSYSRDRSPYSDYRLLPWKAFYYGFNGVGFWNYASFEGKDDISKDDYYLNGAKDYSVIYTESDQIIASRRWEAFNLGLEDYKILMVYADKFGDAKAKEIAKDVIDNPHNLGLADSVIQEALRIIFTAH